MEGIKGVWVGGGGWEVVVDVVGCGMDGMGDMWGWKVWGGCVVNGWVKGDRCGCGRGEREVLGKDGGGRGVVEEVGEEMGLWVGGVELGEGGGDVGEGEGNGEGGGVGEWEEVVEGGVWDLRKEGWEVVG